MRLLYTVIYYLAVPVVMLRQIWRARRDRRHIERLPERFGFIGPITGQQTRIWLHTVSVGEFLGALPLIHQLLARPNTELIVTCMTLTGSERIRASLGDRVHHFYMPYDLPGAIRRFIKTAEPDLLVIMETELWPNTLAECHARGVATLLINARLSERSAKGYARLPRLTTAMLSRLGGAAIQQQMDAERFVQLGLDREKVQVTGNIKFDVELTQSMREQALSLQEQWTLGGQRKVWLVASTHPGEDEIVLDTLARLRKRGIASGQLLLVLVPRHPERFDQVAQMARRAGFEIERRTSGTAPGIATDVLLGDTMGELQLMYGASDFVFMGGSLAPVGGHNFIEAALWAKPLLSGPHLFNFSGVSAMLREAEALRVVEGAESLTAELVGLIGDDTRAQSMGAAALNVAEANRGALDKTLKMIESLV
ncbi:lipid IV(A) 3-deoxy-D-manno-octulosonic acid transferase [Gilvimarinus sp. SDUM040013]|uniref:3-deoxy-D-manno-octulosonic acid transferase n=1 Tax=Gilvimarinus gilvus TaxID=3058038 RepID=A0ABU4RV65_9GAMM|nr:lipid IV(A) 3-deoxy-D-manno-octulosonic acid transferase [Gilvimarinus sp. SDUM040013]MDO3387879.1 lipid IV(A) 3-deoxy-D-manno-octulosonic acid transferase [Gilvimarinus sp. SDUM040013]MDX6848750.1 lipid IV(A) 3-deoxy-D-manno-octulosonic acid transferase [Gilvimarinus sp. SDUM040013]